MCDRCKDTKWVCEQHPDKPMNHDGDTCAGPGEPCPDCRVISTESDADD